MSRGKLMRKKGEKSKDMGRVKGKEYVKILEK